MLLYTCHYKKYGWVKPLKVCVWARAHVRVFIVGSTTSSDRLGQLIIVLELGHFIKYACRP